MHDVIFQLIPLSGLGLYQHNNEYFIFKEYIISMVKKIIQFVLFYIFGQTNALVCLHCHNMRHKDQMCIPLQKGVIFLVYLSEYRNSN